MSYEKLSQSGFICEFKEVSEGPHSSKFCFVLGAGASKSSGIKIGQELIDIWEKELIERNKEAYLKWMNDKKITEENKYSYYSQYYEKRFNKRPMDGLNFLEKMMENVNPGVGYVVLAYLLTETKHNVVITTNFDHLIEDAVKYYSHTIPLVIGHESLAHYITKQIARPTIIKIHRDLLLDPKNTTKEVEKLHEGMGRRFGKDFEEYHPVFIGYAGNDNSLMDYLIENKERFNSGEWKFPYWMLYKSSSPEWKVKDFLEATDGYCINCNGFDEVMCLIGEELKYTMPTEEDFLRDVKERYKKLSSAFENILANKSLDNSERNEGDLKALGQAVQTITEKSDSVAKSTKASLLYTQGKYQEALQLRRELIKEEPENARYHAALSVTLYAMKNYEEAKTEAESAVEMEPDNATYHNNLGAILHEMEKYEEARKEKEIAVELEPEDANYRKSLGITLDVMEKYEEACKEKTKAVELEPEKAHYHDSLSMTLHEMGKYEEARKEAEVAIKLEPEKAHYHDSLSTTLYEMGEYEEARKEAEIAIKLGSEKASYHDSLSMTLHRMGEYEEARREAEIAIKLEPEKAGYHDSLSMILHRMGEYEEARKEAEIAIKLEPEKASYHHCLGVILHEMEKYEEARKEKTQAVELEPENTKYQNSLDITLSSIKGSSAMQNKDIEDVV